MGAHKDKYNKKGRAEKQMFNHMMGLLPSGRKIGLKIMFSFFLSID